MALWIMGFGGTVGVGNLIAGPIVERGGDHVVLLFGAGVALLPGLVRRPPRALSRFRSALEAGLAQ